MYSKVLSKFLRLTYEYTKKKNNNNYRVCVFFLPKGFSHSIRWIGMVQPKVR